MENQIIRQNEISDIARIAPDAIVNNQTSAQACVDYGNKLLEMAEKGMNDDMDEKLRKYINKSRTTVTTMTERRKPVTQLFDNIRSGFTELERMIDPKVVGTPANRAQKLRDDYARRKLEEEQKRRRETELKAQMEQARTRYRYECEKELFEFFNQKTTQAINRLISLNSSLELSNFDAVSAEITSFDCNFPVSELSRYTFAVLLPSSLPMQEIQEIQKSVLEKGKALMDQYSFDVSGQKDSITQLLPSKYNELLAIERQKKTDAEAAARRQEEMKRKEREEQARKEIARQQEEQRRKQEEELKKAQTSVNGLFATSEANMVSTVPQKKVKVKKLVSVKNPNGYADIFNYWWIGEGQYMSKEELEKVFKKQITFAEKAANQQNPDFIKSENIEYIDDVKAK